ncbi:HpcH/HpaI aldolase/citrate lyase family protein [Ruegeria lacuscaerulensis]|uniref:HpcH/HpaI aldolase/citrate lyase family protein n=1 Tax=Ruegeria lacuscaerulensis TaxID=55218 RepID=UPI00147F7306|nr:CoA ester lyase [Ruegeria lacuscaerulensis]
MSLPSHAFRSWLFVPGDKARKLNKALQSDADVVIFDLEDAVSPVNKDIARSLTYAALAGDSGPARYVRVNDFGTGRTEGDVAETIGAEPDGYVLPKCEGPQDIEKLAAIIRSHGNFSPGILAICTETVRGVRNLMRLDWSHPMLIGLAWGGEDLQADLGARSNRTLSGQYLPPFAMARELALYAARDAGVLAIDAVFADFRNETGLLHEVELSKQFGFDGKLSIHLDQLPIIRSGLQAGEAEIAWAEQVLSLLEASGNGVAELNGSMLDRPHLRLAKKILAEAQEKEAQLINPPRRK